jgi:RHS repeat-associated protein
MADAVRFVSNDAESPLYVHADHLATPRRMTDQAASLVWDKVQRPFGETFSVSGPSTNQRRFPGQLHDPETGFHYNYFRDYDPTTGRYLQSDPIGLLGGLNTYAYIGGNPVRRIDPEGLFAPAAAAIWCASNPMCWGPPLAGLTYCLIHLDQCLLPNLDFPTEICPPMPLDWPDEPLQNESNDPNNPDSNNKSPTKPPFRGDPGSRTNTNDAEGRPFQDREYGSDGYPDKDIDYGHDHGQG